LTKFRIHIIFIIAICFSCSSKKNQPAPNVVNANIEKRLIIKGLMDCPSGKIEYSQESISVKFDQSICSLFESELDTLGDTILWYMRWNKKENKYWPISSFIKIYENGKITYEREMSFKTGPWVEDEAKFKNSIYYKIWILEPRLFVNEKITIKDFDILMTIKN
jgi:hypothetical protein